MRGFAIFSDLSVARYVINKGLSNGNSLFCMAFEDALDFGLTMLDSGQLNLKKERKCSVKATYERIDVFVRVPAGYGKRLCYQVLPFIFDYKLGLTGSGKKQCCTGSVTISILMLDQVQSLRRKNVKVSIISSGMYVHAGFSEFIDH